MQKLQTTLEARRYLLTRFSQSLHPRRNDYEHSGSRLYATRVDETTPKAPHKYERMTTIVTMTTYSDMLALWCRFIDYRTCAFLFFIFTMKRHSSSQSRNISQSLIFSINIHLTIAQSHGHRKVTKIHLTILQSQ
jgi:hypothetical protein